MIAIKAENISKQYRLGRVGSGTLSHDLNRWWHAARGKEDPYLKIGESNDRGTKGESEYVWSLKDINFEVQQGEVLGIIGRNGAGKSTLLKLLSQITQPTTGNFKIKGRIASLLEVGTGFHPEMTGRENIFLNGSILGMTRSEIKSKFDEIVDFSGIERYVDTPVKRYSSGMYVRLAFAVAAHLESEILILDEVLAVGDAEFQKKCLGKMKDVSLQGRTVLFVSHNMAAVKSLCTSGLLLETGEIKLRASVDEVVSYYLGGDSDLKNYRELKSDSLKKSEFVLENFGVKGKNKDYSDAILRDDDLEFHLNCINNSVHHEQDRFDVTLKFKSETGEYILVTSTGAFKESKMKNGENHLIMRIPGNFFNVGVFYLDLLIVRNKREVIHSEQDIISFNINPENIPLGSWMGKEVGYLQPTFDWS